MDGGTAGAGERGPFPALIGDLGAIIFTRDKEQEAVEKPIFGRGKNTKNTLKFCMKQHKLNTLLASA